MSRDWLDIRVANWLQEGPDEASRATIDATFGPLGHIPQRRGWRGLMPRFAFGERARVLATLMASALVVLTLLALGATFNGGPRPIPASVPAWRLAMTGSVTRSLASDPAATLNQCRLPAAGSWSYLYAGGDPFGTLDVLIGDGANTTPGSDRVGAEIEFDSLPTVGYVRFDPAALRGGDGPGRSSAEVTVTTTADSVTIVVHAETPDRTSGVDGPPVVVDLTLTCPR
jgi:hypothetical protein